MKILNGSDLADYVKERQLKQVRALRQACLTIPRLAIVSTGHNPVIDTYVRLKSEYGSDITVQVDTYILEPNDLITKIESLNADPLIHGIIVQLPLSNPEITQHVIDTINPAKDVDGLGDSSDYVPATAMAIDWLMAGYNIALRDKKIAIVGQGRLVGTPLAKLWRSAGLQPAICDINTDNLAEVLQKSDVIVSATGAPGLITNDMIVKNTTIVDAGTAAEHGKIVGDVSDEVRSRRDINITPRIGGVGPLTVAALFDNVIQVARQVANVNAANSENNR